MKAKVALLLGCWALLLAACSEGGDVTAGPDATLGSERVSGADRSSGSTEPESRDDPTPSTTTPADDTTSTSTDADSDPDDPTDDDPPDEGPLGDDDVVVTIDQARSIFDQTDDVVAPIELAQATEAALEALLDGEVTDLGFFDLARETLPFGVAGLHYLVCDVEALGDGCVTTQADYLDFVQVCREAEAMLYERLIDRDDVWVGTGVCFVDPDGGPVEASL